ncbi:FxLYD domain-containing protein [Patescibacteria group bacterium]
MSKRSIKQIFIVLISVIILSMIGFVIYYIVKPVSSCFDGIQNQNEENIDCGGVCSSCEIIYPEDIDILSSEAILSQGNFYDAAIKIKNPNQNSGSGYIPYKLELYNQYDELVGNRSGATFVLPNQTKYIIELKIESSDVVRDIKISFGRIVWQKLSEQIPQLAVIQKEYSQNKVKGILINKTDLNFNNVDINILLFDSSKKLIGLNIAKIETLPAGQERDFAVVWFKEISGNVAFVEAEAETNIYVQSF